MANKKIADLIANGLREGMMHPGRDGSPPSPIVLPFFRTEGLANEQAQLVNETATLLSEAIVALIEGENEIVDKDELAELRVAEANAPRRQVAVYATGDAGRRDPLFILSVTNAPYVMIDENQLMTGLEQRLELARQKRENARTRGGR